MLPFASLINRHMLNGHVSCYTYRGSSKKGFANKLDIWRIDISAMVGSGTKFLDNIYIYLLSRD